MSITNGIHPPVDLTEQVKQLREEMQQYRDSYALLLESIPELERDDQGWQRLGDLSDTEFSRLGLKNITRLARLMFLKNPLVQRGVSVKRFYVWGQGVNITAKDTDINAVVQAFTDDVKNRVELTSHQARMMKEVDLQIDGNIFFIFFVNADTGHTRIRTIPYDEIDDVICNPQDSKEPWYYKRIWKEHTFSESTGQYTTDIREDYYPDWGYEPQSQPATINGKPVHWDAPIYHIKVGGFSHWKFGLSEVYAAIDWATAYKVFLENWATITRALAQFAQQVTGLKSKASAIAGKALLQTGLPTSANNPAKLPGSTFLGIDGVKIEPIRTGGATTSADDGRRMALMAMMVQGLPETFYSDASVGTLATAKSLDRPTELMMTDRQTFWADALRNIYQFVILQAVDSPGGPLRTMGKVVTEEDGSDGTDRIVWNDGVNAGLDVMFPPLISSDIAGSINAIVNAATLGGSTRAGTMDDKTVTQLLLNTLGVPNVDEVMDGMFDDAGNLLKPPPPKASPFAPVAPPAGPPQGATPPPVAQPAIPMTPVVPAHEAMMVEAVREMRGVLTKLLAEAV